jgi:hypothetical protein
MAAQRAERKRLRALSLEPGKVTEQPTGQICAQLWSDIDFADRSAVLRQHGFTVTADTETVRLERG